MSERDGRDGRGRTEDAHEDRVDDPDRLERVLTADQRAIVGALIATVAGRPGLDPASVRVEATDPERPSFRLQARIDEPRSELRRELLPFVSALNAVAMSATMRVRTVSGSSARDGTGPGSVVTN